VPVQERPAGDRPPGRLRADRRNGPVPQGRRGPGLRVPPQPRRRGRDLGALGREEVPRRRRQAGTAGQPVQGHHRPPPPDRGRREPGLPRRPDGPAQPRLFQSQVPGGRRRLGDDGRAVRPDHGRRRPLQGHQRHPGSRRRRRPAETPGRDAARGLPRGRHRGAAGRRRVRGDPARPAFRGRHDAAGQRPAGPAAPADRARRPQLLGQRQHRGGPARRSRRRPQPHDQERRHRALSGQGRGPQPQRRLRSLDALGPGTADRAAARRARGDHRPGVRALLSAGGRHRVQQRQRLRGPDALGPSRAGRADARPLHGRVRGPRPVAEAGRPGVRDRAEADARLVGRRRRVRPRGRQHLGGPVPQRDAWPRRFRIGSSAGTCPASA
jgi:hypothetical protein